jgi:hypothetical protein
MTNERLSKDSDWYAFDLDGTLAYAEEGEHYDCTVIGSPVPKMIAIVKKYLSEGKTVKIFTARYWRRHSNPEVIPAIENWCLENIGQVLEITNAKTPGMKELWDDRSITIERNTGRCARFTSKGLEEL